MDKIFDSLNQAQTEAVMSVDGHICVTAGAGSGKTRTLARRFAYLVRQAGVKPEEILSITFTNRAAAEMKKRILPLIGGGEALYISTFHGFCARVLRSEIERLNYPTGFRIIDKADQQSLICDIYRAAGRELSENEARAAASDIYDQKTKFLMQYVEAITAKDGCSAERGTLLARYMRAERRNRLLDFADLINFVIYMFRKFPSVLEKWQARFKYIQADEFQDVSDKEYELLTMLSAKHGNLYVTGDADQTIYEWRGANPDYMISFQKTFPDAKMITLDKNYRSGRDILKVSNALIKNNTRRIEKALTFANDSAGDRSVLYHHADSMKSEAKWIAERIAALIAGGEVRAEDIAVLYRQRAPLAQLQSELTSAKIPYKIRDGVEFSRRVDVRVVIAYLQYMVYGDDVAFTQIINYPARRIDSRRLALLRAAAEKSGGFMGEELEKRAHEPDFAATGASDFSATIASLRKLCADRGVGETLREIVRITAMRNQAELSAFLRYSDELLSSCVQKLTAEAYLQQIALRTQGDISPSVDCVSLMTVHAAKGLEFPAVFVCGMSEGLFPCASESENELEAERRIAYVAFTRAEKMLFLSDSEGFTRDDSPLRTSRFVAEAAPQLFSGTSLIREDSSRTRTMPLEGLFREFENVILFDLETTGLSPEKNEIIEFACLKAGRDAKIEREHDIFSRLEKAEKLPAEIVSLTSITDELLESRGVSKRELAEVVADILREKTLLIAHNIQFDISFIRVLMCENGFEELMENVSVLDTLTVFRDRRSYPHKLSDAINAYSLQDRVVNSHRGIDDVKALFEVLLAMDAEFSDLEKYINLIGFSPKYGPAGVRLKGVTYLPQGYRSTKKLYL